MPSKRFRLQSLFLFLAATIIFTSTGAYALSQLIAQGYPGNSNLQPGMIVELNPNNPHAVTVVNQKNITKMLGVVISANEAALTISQPTNSQEVYVSNTGQHNVLVTTQDGTISPGDYITISSIAGIGMKANSNQSEALGQAVGSFDGVHNVLGGTTLKNSSGQTKNVAIGLVPVNINISSNPLAKGEKGVPAFLSNLTKFATNKTVSADRIYLGMLCVLAGIIITTSIVYAAIKNGFISIGRNPLAKRAIIFNLFKVIVVALVVFIVSLGGAYLIITQ